MSRRQPLAVVGLPREEINRYIADIQRYHPVFCGQLSGLIAQLVDSQAICLCVADAIPNWQDFIIACKTNPATRRLPVLLFSAQREADLPVEVDVIIRADALPVRLSELIALPDAGADDLTATCSQPLPEQARQAIGLFNQGEYYQQHDLLEALWMETPSSVRDLYQAILQVGIAYYQIERANYRGALKMLLRALQWLNKLPDECQQVDVARLRHDANRVRQEVENVLKGQQTTVDPQLLKPVKLIES